MLDIPIPLFAAIFCNNWHAMMLMKAIALQYGWRLGRAACWTSLVTLPDSPATCQTSVTDGELTVKTLLSTQQSTT